MTIQEELNIVEKAKKDIKAFQTIYDYYFSKIFAYCMNRVASPVIAEDIVSEVFLAAVTGVKKFDTSKGFRFGSWLYRVSHNKVVDYYKSSKANNMVELREFDSDPSTGSGRDEDLDRGVQVSEMQEKVVIILRDLKPRYAQIITLRFYSEFDNPEIADVMNLKTTQVAVILHRALKAFRKKFEESYPESEIYSLF